MNEGFIPMTEDNDLRPEYKPEDLGQGIRGKYYKKVSPSWDTQI
jgi:hypothetical protein